MLKLRSGEATKANALVKSLVEAKPARGKTKRPSVGKKTLDQYDPSTRVDIVSESLCDDLISYLSPTLTQHIGCTLIDLQPGACLFSSKIHDFLKPKRHLLVEPDDYYFKPFIKPLLDQPNSSYCYTPIDITHSTSYWSEIQRVQESPDLLPLRPSLAHDDPKRSQFNPNFLILGNLTRRPSTRSSTHSVQQSKLMLHQFGQHALSHEYLQNTGLVRMLLWMPEYHKTDIFAVLPWRRSAYNIGLNFGFNISEAASVKSLDAVFRDRGRDEAHRRLRSPLLNGLNQRDVRARMRNAGILASSGRQLQIEGPVKRTNHLAEYTSPLKTDIESVPELLSKIEIVSSRIKDMHGWIRNKLAPDRTILEKLEFPQVGLETSSYSYESRVLARGAIERISVLADLNLSVIRIEASLKDLEDKGVELKTLEDLYGRARGLSQAYADLVEKAAPFVQRTVQNLVDDHMAYHLSPSILAFYERSYEPLKADSDDFYPQNSLSLFDFMPKGRDLSVPDLASNEEAGRFCAELLQIMFSSTSLTLPQALDRVGVNAAQDLIPMVPAITDARKGGRLDPNNIRVRMMTEEMLEGLVKAFFEWPFKPQSWELTLNSESPKEEESEADSAV